MLLAGAHEAPDCHDRRVHDTQLAVAGQEGAAPQQEGHGARHIEAAPGPHLVAGAARGEPWLSSLYASVAHEASVVISVSVSREVRISFHGLSGSSDAFAPSQ